MESKSCFLTSKLIDIRSLPPFLIKWVDSVTRDTALNLIFNVKIHTWRIFSKLIEATEPYILHLLWRSSHDIMELRLSGMRRAWVTLAASCRFLLWIYSIFFFNLQPYMPHETATHLLPVTDFPWLRGGSFVPHRIWQQNFHEGHFFNTSHQRKQKEGQRSKEDGVAEVTCVFRSWRVLLKNYCLGESKNIAVAKSSRSAT